MSKDEFPQSRVIVVGQSYQTWVGEHICRSRGKSQVGYDVGSDSKVMIQMVFLLMKNVPRPDITDALAAKLTSRGQPQSFPRWSTRLIHTRSTYEYIHVFNLPESQRSCPEGSESDTQSSSPGRMSSPGEAARGCSWPEMSCCLVPSLYLQKIWSWCQWQWLWVVSVKLSRFNPRALCEKPSEITILHSFQSLRVCNTVSTCELKNLIRSLVAHVTLQKLQMVLVPFHWNFKSLFVHVLNGSATNNDFNSQLIRWLFFTTHWLIVLFIFNVVKSA